MNGIRYRHSLPMEEVAFLPSGTSSNEAAHAEINRWFTNTKDVHQAAIIVKLRVFLLAKLLVHNKALSLHTSRQLRTNELLMRCIATTTLWTPEAWQEWCNGIDDEGVEGRSRKLPLFMRRRAHQVPLSSSYDGFSSVADWFDVIKQIPLSRYVVMLFIVLKCSRLDRHDVRGAMCLDHAFRESKCEADPIVQMLFNVVYRSQV